MSPPTTPLRAALAVALLMIAFQVASKAVRDAFYLAAFPAAALPPIVIGSAILSIACVPLYARLLALRGPRRVLPITFATSGLLLLVVWSLSHVVPGPAAVVLYLHVAVLGPVLVSCFWALVSETFDARAAKRQIGWIGGFGTAGGLLGGMLAFTLAGGTAATYALPTLAVIHFVCASIVPYVTGGRAHVGVADAGLDLVAGVSRVARDGYLARLALLVASAAACAALLDFAFKSAVADAMGARGDLLRSFSVYYGGVALVTFLAQIALTGRVLAALGPAGSAALLPATAALAGVGALFAPGGSGIAVARGAENVARNSMFRSGYELLFAPLDESERRSNKTLIDVGAERAGDMLGGILVATLLGLGAQGRPPILIAAIVLAITAFALAWWFRTGYMRRIEARLRAHDPGGQVAQETAAFDMATLTSTSLDWSQGIDLASLGASGEFNLRDLPRLRPDSEAAPPPASPTNELDEALRSNSTTRIRRALLDGPPLDAELLRRILPLLARERLASPVLAALRNPPAELATPLVEFMLDASQDLAARRRVPRIVSRCDSPIAVDGLFRGLSDARFEMRVQCGRALLRLRERLASRPGAPGRLDPERVMAAVLREVDVGLPVWQAQQASGFEDWGEESPLIEHVVRERANASLAHVFTLLAIVLPRQSLEQAVRGVQGDDPMQRGLALEYLESVLPPEVREKLWPFLEVEVASRRAEPRERSVADVLAANESIAISLEDLRKIEAMAREARQEALKQDPAGPPESSPPSRDP